MNAQIALAVRRVLAALVALGTVAFAAEIPVHAHRHTLAALVYRSRRARP